MGKEVSDLSSEKILNGFIERSGIIREPSYGNVDFIHRTFQEYMAARSACEEGDWGLLLKNSGDDQWQETIVLAVGFANQSEADTMIINLLSKNNDTTNENYYFDLLAMSCLETAVMISENVRSKVKERIKSLIPPNSNLQRKALAATRDLAVPYLGWKKDYSEDEIIACIKALGDIASTKSLNQISNYLVIINSERIINTIKEVLLHISPRECSNSKLANALLKYIISKVDNEKLNISGIILNSLAAESYQKIYKYLSNKITNLQITECDMFTLSNIYKFPKIMNLTLDGTFNTIVELKELKVLNSLEIRCNTTVWPDLSVLCSLSYLSNLSIINFSVTWPEITGLQSIRGLTKLHLASFNGADIEYYILEQISYLRNLKQLHLSFSKNIDLDISVLSELGELEVIELSTYTKYLPENVIAFNDLKNLKKVVINVDKEDLSLNKFVMNLQFCLPNINIELITGWKVELDLK